MGDSQRVGSWPNKNKENYSKVPIATTSPKSQKDFVQIRRCWREVRMTMQDNVKVAEIKVFAYVLALFQVQTFDKPEAAVTAFPVSAAMKFTKPAWVMHKATGGLDAKIRIWSTKPILNHASKMSMSN
ncbi:hypothetical protein BDR06DRAFT_970039 [Suillus hirtellus]|nr:hypothetical protein BDR06DRAFT_970039 [Suillus hirtellus]